MSCVLSSHIPLFFTQYTLYTAKALTPVYIQDQKPRLTQQRDPKPQPLLHPQRKCPRLFLPCIRKVHQFQHFPNPGIRYPQDQRPDLQILPGRQVLIYRGRLHQCADLCQILPAPWMSVKKHLPAGGPENPCQHLQDR